MREGQVNVVRVLNYQCGAFLSSVICKIRENQTKMEFTLALCLLAFCYTVVDAADEACLGRGGHCQEDHLHCTGSYQSGLCAGHASRRCCVPPVTDTLDCTGSRRYSARGTGYYPDSSPLEGGYVDMHDARLHTLQDFLDGSASIVVVAMDNHAGIRYDTPVCIPELNHKYGRFIDFRVRDTGSAFAHKGYSRIDICTRSYSYSLDSTINGPLTLVFH